MICHLHYQQQPCEQCGVNAFLRRVGLLADTPRRYHSVQSFGEIVIDNMFAPWETPFPVTSREQLREECAKRGVYSQYLLDSVHWHAGGRKWF